MRDILLLQLGRLGDLVQTLPLMRRLREEHSGCRITVVCLETFHGILADSGGWDVVVPVDLVDVDALADPAIADAFPSQAPWNRFPVLAGEFDLLVNLTHDLGSAVLADRIRAVRKLGRLPAPQGELRLKGSWSKYLFSMVSHRRESLFNLVDLHCGMAGLAFRPVPPSLVVPEVRETEARTLLRTAGWKGGHPLVAFQTGASDLHRAWDTDSFGDLAMRLAADGAEVVLVGDGKEVDRAARIRERTVGTSILDLVGKTSLVQLAAVAKACDLLVSNDTGTIHVAAAVGTPTLGLYFSTAYYTETAPYGEGHAVLQVELPCSPCNASDRCAEPICRARLTVESVHAAARWQLQPGSAPPASGDALALYRSRFLAGGSLLYAPPDPERFSAHYASSLLGRVLWEAAEDIPLEASLAAAARRAAWSEGLGRAETLAESLVVFAEQLERGRTLALRLGSALDSGNAALVHPLHIQLAGLGQSLSQGAARCGLFGSYLNYEMMDLESSVYPALAAELARKYGELRVRIDRALAALDGLLDSGRTASEPPTGGRMSAKVLI